MTPSTVSPRARAAKLSAMRWRRTGAAIASTSSSVGAKRPFSAARARATSVSACAARGPGPQTSVSATHAGASGAPGRADKLHNAGYQPDEGCIPVGVQALSRAALELLA